MTCIVSFFDKDRIILAGDKCAGNTFSKSIIMESKVFFNGGFMIGASGKSFRASQILRHVWQPPRKGYPGESTEYFLYNYVLDSIRDVFKKNDITLDEDSFILCYDNRIFEITESLAIIEDAEKITCIGSGCYHARAVIQALRGYEKDFSVILKNVFGIVSRNVTTVSNEYDYITSDELKGGKP